MVDRRFPAFPVLPGTATSLQGFNRPGVSCAAKIPAMYAKQKGPMISRAHVIALCGCTRYWEADTETAIRGLAPC